jgi:CRISPR-associated Csx2 family protein
LFEWLSNQQSEVIDELVVIGTAGSAWSTLHELVPGWDTDQAASEDWLALKEREIEGKVTEQMLDLVSERLASQLAGAGVRCVLIGHCHLGEEQRALLGSIAGVIPPNERVFLDITHGFRHFGVLAIQSLMFLAQAIDVTIEGVYYGMFEPNRAVSLAGGQQLTEWAEALVLMKRAGQLAPLVPLLQPGYPSIAKLIDELHFLLSINAFDRAITKYGQVKGQIKRMQAGSLLDVAIGHIIAEDLRTLFDSTLICDIQRRMARRALATGDSMRAAVLTYEAVLSAGISDPKQVMRFETRKRVRGMLDTGNHFQGNEKVVFETLTKVRNCVAHGSNQHAHHNSNVAVSRALSSPDDLRAFVESAMDALEPLIEHFKADPLV